MTLVYNLYTASVVVCDDSLILFAKGIFECDINTVGSRLLLFLRRFDTLKMYAGFHGN